MKEEKRPDVVSEPPQQVRKPLTLAQNVVLTIKVLVAAGLVFAAIVAILRFAQ
jgi:hypothetical protein